MAKSLHYLEGLLDATSYQLFNLVNCGLGET